MRVTITGVDPGLVHTGVVGITLDTEARTWDVQEEAVPGVKDAEGKTQVDVYTTAQTCAAFGEEHVFIEAYRPRSHFDTDSRMQAAVRELRASIPGSKIINNTGVKQVVGKPLMQLFAVWTFVTSTNHQDLRSAARIGIYGALKDTELNAVLTQFVNDNLDGPVWTRRAASLI